MKRKKIEPKVATILDKLDKILKENRMMKVIIVKRRLTPEVKKELDRLIQKGKRLEKEVR